MAVKKNGIKATPVKSSQESKISILLGALVVIVVGVLVYNYFSRINRNYRPSVSIKDQQTKTGTESAGLTNNNFPSTYKVKDGDDLWHIAENIYGDGYKWVDIAKANSINNPDLIENGMVLKLPKIAVQKGDIDGPGIQTASAKAITSSTYTVAKGDFLWEIAVRACGDGYKWINIAQANKLVNPDIIHSGNVFKISCK